ncbi:MAG: ABC transporter permease [Gemmataceae bacterium]
MRLTDLIALAFSALLQQKVRTTLTLLGVIIGTFVLLLSLSIGQGVRGVITNVWRRNDQLRRINVWQGRRNVEQDVPAAEIKVPGEMSAERRERLRQVLVRRWPGKPKQDLSTRITPERLNELAALDHVAAVVPSLRWSGVRVRFNQNVQRASAASAEPDDPYFRARVVAGEFFRANQPNSAMVSEYLLYQLGVQDEADVAKALDKKLRLEISTQPYRSNSVLALLSGEGGNLTPAEEDVLGKVADKLPAAVAGLDLTAEERETLTRLLKRPKTRPSSSTPVTVVEELTIRGVFRMPTREELRDRLLESRDDIDVLIPSALATELYFRLPGNREQGDDSVAVRVDSEDHVKEVDQRISDMGLESYAPIKILEGVRLNVLLVSLATTFVALVALIVAGIGITNTLLMSVLERTHEIGVMKAIGGRDRHIQMLFVLEGAWVGLLGSGVGLLCGWLASIPGDRIARRLAHQQERMLVDVSLFAFPWWLVLGVPLFVTLLTMLAALYPARRAARVNPMTALRHE